MHVQRNHEERSYNHVCRGKAVDTTHSECVFTDLVIQHAERLCPVTSSVASPALQHFFYIIS